MNLSYVVERKSSTQVDFPLCVFVVVVVCCFSNQFSNLDFIAYSFFCSFCNRIRTVTIYTHTHTPKTCVRRIFFPSFRNRLSFRVRFQFGKKSCHNFSQNDCEGDEVAVYYICCSYC